MQFGKVAFLGSEAAGEAAITVRRVQGTAGGVTVHLATDNGTAIGGQDFSPVGVDVTFGPGETTKTVKVPITQDALARKGTRACCSPCRTRAAVPCSARRPRPR